MVSATERIGNLTKYSGGALVIVPWIIFLICYLLNPQWILTKDALSSFGDPSFTQYPWVYNVGLGVISVIIWLMSLGIVATAENKVQVFGGAFWFVAGIFLALIGYYHGGTYPHDFVSTWFFVQAAFSITIMGLGSYPEHDFRGSVIPIIIALLMPLGGILVHFPSAATTEIYEIIIIDAWAVFSLFHKPVGINEPAAENPEGLLKNYRVQGAIVGILAFAFFALGTLVVMFSFT